MFKRSIVYPILLLCTLIVLPVTAFAIPSLKISSPSGNGVFILQGAGLEGVAGMELRIGYDDTLLSNPKVTMGGLVGSMMNAINSGSNPIRIAIVSATTTIRGSGTIATINFDRTGASLGRITTLTGNIIDLDGKNLAMAKPVIVNPQPVGNSGSAGTFDVKVLDTTDTITRTPPPTSGSTPPPVTPGYSQPVVGGTISFPPYDTADKDNKEPAAQPAPQDNQDYQVAARDSAAPAPEAAEPAQPPAPAPKETAPPAPAPQPIQSVLERFRLFTGERTVKNLSAMFDKESAASYSQSPAIGISDGKAKVKLVIQVAGDKTPNFTFNSARYVSLKQIGDGEWEVEAKPDKGAVKAGVAMLLNGVVQEFPLTVSPKAEVALKKSGEAAEADFLLFLKERGTASSPKYDMNGDGRRDYLDDYIYTANYLVKIEEKTKKKKTTEHKHQ